MNPLRRGRAPLAIVLVLAFAAAQLGTALHVVIERHVTCEHGELIHGEPAAGQPAQTPALATVGPGQRDSSPGHLHEHCAASQPGNDHRDARVVRPGTPGSSLHFVTLVATAPPATRGLASPLYRLAPKTSPPAPSAS